MCVKRETERQKDNVYLCAKSSMQGAPVPAWHCLACSSPAGPLRVSVLLFLFHISLPRLLLLNSSHSVCRFLIPLGIAFGAELTFGQFITQNLIPVTLGNIVGGLVFM